MLLKEAQYPITCQKGLEYWTKMGHLKCLEKSSKINQVKHRPGKPVVGDSTSLVNLGTTKYQVLTVYILHWGGYLKKWRIFYTRLTELCSVNLP